MIAVEVELLEVCSDHVEHSWYLLLIVVVHECQQFNYGLEHIVGATAVQQKVHIAEHAALLDHSLLDLACVQLVYA